MAEHSTAIDYDRIAASAPADATAARVTSQTGCEDSVLRLDEIPNLLIQLERKLAVAKQALGIKNRRQHKNLMKKYNQRGQTTDWHREPKLLAEYITGCMQIRKLQDRLHAAKRDTDA